MTRLNNIVFTLFITFSIFNLYKFELIQNIGKYGKIIVVPFIIYYIINKSMKNKILKFDFFISLIFLFFIIGSINSIFSLNNYDGLAYSLIFILYIIYFYYFTHQFKESYGNDFFNILIIKLKNIFLYNLILGFIIGAIINQPLWVPNKDGLDFGGFLGASLLFGWLSLAFFYCLYFLKNKTIIDYLLILICIIFIIISEGRGAQLALVSFFLFHIYFKLMFNFINPYFRFLLKLILIIIVLFLLYSIIFNISYTQVNELSTGRLFIWDIAVKNIFHDNIFYFGYGLNTYQEYLLNKYFQISYYFKRIKDVDGNLSLHSSYLTLVATGGILSLASFFIVIYKVIYKNKDYIVVAFVISLLLGGIVEQFIISPNIPISMLFWLIIIYSLNKKREI